MLRAALALLLALVAVALVACGGDDGAPASGGGGGETAEGRPAGLPAVPVVDLRSDEQLTLADAPRGGRPLLVWFWAPS